MSSKWTICVCLFIASVYINDIHCGLFSSKSSSSRGSGSRGSSSSSSSSRGSSSSSWGSRGSSSSSWGSGGSSSSSWGSGGSNYRVTSRPTYRTTKYHPITTMPTRRTTRYYPVTTMPTRRTTRYYPVTTMPTRRTTRYHPITTMPTKRTTYTRQPPFNPNYNPAPNRNNHSSNPFFPATTKKPFLTNSGRNNTYSTTRQPPYNPFFSTTTRRPTFNNSNSNSGGSYTKQPPYNPYFTSTTKQPPYNPYFTSTTKQPFRTTSNYYKNNTFNSNGRFNTTNNGRFTQKPIWTQTTKVPPLGSGIYRPGLTAQTVKPLYQGPSYNASSFRPGPSTKPGSVGVYHPPATIRNNTYNTGSSSSNNNYPRPSFVNPVQPTIINNNNHYYPPHPNYYTPGYNTAGTTHVTVINNNYHPNHQVILPSYQYHSYGPPAVGISITNTHYYDTYSPSRYHTTYHYSTYDTGSSSLGFFLGYQLGRINRPSYYYHSTSYVNQEYVPRYDHYTVHHYYHNGDTIPKESPIQPNAVVLCAGDSANLCPPGNYPLCTNNGAVMCVVDASATVPCNNAKKLNCVTSTIPCEGNNSPECKQKTSASVSIPCVSTASIAAGVTYVNNSILVTNPADSTVNNFCVTVLALPTKNDTKTNGTKIVEEPFLYTTNDTGVDLLGYYLGEKLQKLVQPSYVYLNYDENYNYVEKFDHYDVFHYYHDGNVLSKEVEFKQEQIMNCAGDSGTFCPQFTLSLCLNDGSVACVADASSTLYNNDTKMNYLNGTISCDKLKSPVCTSNPSLVVPVQVPCISTAKVYANVSLMIRNFNGNQYYRTIEVPAAINGTTNGNITGATNGTVTGATNGNITGTTNGTVTGATNGTVTGTTNGNITPREFCVAILVSPGVKVVKPTPEKTKITGLPYQGDYLSLPKYNYKPTGNTTIESYLAYRLGRLLYPSYYYMNAYWFSTTGAIQKYDHYTSVSYYNRKEMVPKYLEFQSYDLRSCEGDTGRICPTNTSAICLNDGGVMCLTDQLWTVPCLKYNDTVCVRSIVTCENGKPCNKNKNTRVSIPCISTATIYGDVMGVKHSIYKKSASAAKSYVDLVPVPGANVNNTPVYHKAQQFCVTLVALPAERKITEGEKFFENSDSLFARLTSKFFG